MADLGRFDESIDRLQLGIRLNPDAASLYTTLGYRLEAKGQLPEALNQHRKAVGSTQKIRKPTKDWSSRADATGTI